MLCLDVANGYSQHFVDFLRKMRKEFPAHIIMAGNVVIYTYIYIYVYIYIYIYR